MADIEDKTGQPPSDSDVEEAIAVVTKYRANMKFMMANPEFAVNLGNIGRCLRDYQRLRTKAG